MGEFVEFLSELVAGEQLEGASGGVAKKVVADGSMRDLTNKQHYALIAGVTEWFQQRFPEYRAKTVALGEAPEPPVCSECPEQMPWSEVYLAGELYHGRCSYCEQVHHKDKD